MREKKIKEIQRKLMGILVTYFVDLRMKLLHLKLMME